MTSARGYSISAILLGSSSRACRSSSSKGGAVKASGGGFGKLPQLGTSSLPSSMCEGASEKIVDAELHRASPPHQRARPQSARQGHVARRSSGARARRRRGRHRRQHLVAHAEGDDLGVDPGSPQGPFLCPPHYL